MIQRIDTNLQTSWQKELAMAVSDPENLLKILSIDSTYYGEKDFKARKLFPMKVPLPFIQKMELGNPNDPLLLQVMPSVSEYLEHAQFSKDPLLEQNNQQPGVLHKYKSRVLLMLRGGCAVNCRYCFRRHFPYQDNHLNKRALEQAVDYIAADNQINEVILSGGDPLMAGDDTISWLMDKLEALPQIKRMRIHTRLPVVIPNRITSELCQRFKSSSLQVVMVTHINHGNEIDSYLANKFAELKQAGVTLLNQSVLLKNVNDDANVLCELSEALFSAGIIPYYLHLLDKVEGASHFDIDESQARELIKTLLLELPGFLVPKLVREIGGERSKTPIDLRLND